MPPQPLIRSVVLVMLLTFLHPLIVIRPAYGQGSLFDPQTILKKLVNQNCQNRTKTQQSPVFKQTPSIQIPNVQQMPNIKQLPNIQQLPGIGEFPVFQQTPTVKQSTNKVKVNCFPNTSTAPQATDLLKILNVNVPADPLKECAKLINMGKEKYSCGDVNGSFNFFNYALNQMNGGSDKRPYVDALKDIGFFFQSKGDNDDALEYLTKAVDSCASTNDEQALASLLNKMEPLFIWQETEMDEYGQIPMPETIPIDQNIIDLLNKVMNQPAVYETPGTSPAGETQEDPATTPPEYEDTQVATSSTTPSVVQLPEDDSTVDVTTLPLPESDGSRETSPVVTTTTARNGQQTTTIEIPGVMKIIVVNTAGTSGKEKGKQNKEKSGNKTKSKQKSVKTAKSTKTKNDRKKTTSATASKKYTINSPVISVKNSGAHEVLSCVGPPANNRAYNDLPVKKEWSGSHINPVPGGRYAPYEGDTGLDIVAPRGYPFFAAKEGIVLYNSASGHCRQRGPNDDQGAIRVRHPDGTDTFYAHLSGRRATLQAGSRINQGVWLGNIGKANSVPHLHFTIYYGPDHSSYVGAFSTPGKLKNPWPEVTYNR